MFRAWAFQLKIGQCFQTCDVILVFTYWLLHALSQHGHILRYFDDRCSQDMFVGVIAVNPQETKLLLLGTPRGLKACSICSMLSCSLRKWHSLIYVLRFCFALVLLEG